MAKHGDDRSGNLVCSFCGKSQDEVRKLIAGPTVYICDECIDLCNDIIAEECDQEEGLASTSAVPKPAEIKKVLDQYVIGQESAKKVLAGRRAQPLQADRFAARDRRRRAAEVEHPADRADGLRQDPAGADTGPIPAGALHDRRRHQPYRGRLRRRGRREHHSQLAAECRLRCREGAARHRLHRRDRQDLAQGRQPVDHPRRVGRGRAAGAAEDHRGHHGQRAAQGRAQASAAGVPAGRHHEHPVHLRRRLRRPRGHHPAPHRHEGHGLRRRHPQAAGAHHQRAAARGAARGPAQVRPDPGVRRAPAGDRDASTSSTSTIWSASSGSRRTRSRGSTRSSSRWRAST